MEKAYKIYFDVCCLNRPFDDWSQSRIRIEAEAVLEILARCQVSQFLLVSSNALEAEIRKTPDPGRQERVLTSLIIAKETITVNDHIMARAQEIATLGCKSFDSLHIACAETAKADIFLTTDDRLLRKVQANAPFFKIQVANPVTWLITVSGSSGDA